MPVHSKDIAILGVNVTASWSAGAAKKDLFATPNTDGFEPMWSDNVTVRGCRVKNGDDCTEEGNPNTVPPAVSLTREDH